MERKKFKGYYFKGIYFLLKIIIDNEYQSFDCNCIIKNEGLKNEGYVKKKIDEYLLLKFRMNKSKKIEISYNENILKTNEDFLKFHDQVLNVNIKNNIQQPIQTPNKNKLQPPIPKPLPLPIISPDIEKQKSVIYPLISNKPIEKKSNIIPNTGETPNKFERNERQQTLNIPSPAPIYAQKYHQVKNVKYIHININNKGVQKVNMKSIVAFSISSGDTNLINGNDNKWNLIGGFLYLNEYLKVNLDVNLYFIDYLPLSSKLRSFSLTNIMNFSIEDNTIINNENFGKKYEQNPIVMYEDQITNINTSIKNYETISFNNINHVLVDNKWIEFKDMCLFIFKGKITLNGSIIKNKEISALKIKDNFLKDFIIFTHQIQSVDLFNNYRHFQDEQKNFKIFKKKKEKKNVSKNQAKSIQKEINDYQIRIELIRKKLEKIGYKENSLFLRKRRHVSDIKDFTKIDVTNAPRTDNKELILSIVNPIVDIEEKIKEVQKWKKNKPEIEKIMKDVELYFGFLMNSKKSLELVFDEDLWIIFGLNLNEKNVSKVIRNLGRAICLKDTNSEMVYLLPEKMKMNCLNVLYNIQKIGNRFMEKSTFNRIPLLQCNFNQMLMFLKKNRHSIFNFIKNDKDFEKIESLFKLIGKTGSRKLSVMRANSKLNENVKDDLSKKQITFFYYEDEKSERKINLENYDSMVKEVNNLKSTKPLENIKLEYWKENWKAWELLNKKKKILKLFFKTGYNKKKKSTSFTLSLFPKKIKDLCPLFNFTSYLFKSEKLEGINEEGVPIIKKNIQFFAEDEKELNWISNMFSKIFQQLLSIFYIGESRKFAGYYQLRWGVLSKAWIQEGEEGLKKIKKSIGQEEDSKTHKVTYTNQVRDFDVANIITSSLGIKEKKLNEDLIVDPYSNEEITDSETFIKLLRLQEFYLFKNIPIIYKYNFELFQWQGIDKMFEKIKEKKKKESINLGELVYKKHISFKGKSRDVFKSILKLSYNRQRTLINEINIKSLGNNFEEEYKNFLKENIIAKEIVLCSSKIKEYYSHISFTKDHLKNGEFKLRKLFFNHVCSEGKLKNIESIIKPKLIIKKNPRSEILKQLNTAALEINAKFWNDKNFRWFSLDKSRTAALIIPLKNKKKKYLYRIVKTNGFLLKYVCGTEIVISKRIKFKEKNYDFINLKFLKYNMVDIFLISIKQNKDKNEEIRLIEGNMEDILNSNKILNPHKKMINRYMKLIFKKNTNNTKKEKIANFLNMDFNEEFLKLPCSSTLFYVSLEIPKSIIFSTGFIFKDKRNKRSKYIVENIIDVKKSNMVDKLISIENIKIRFLIPGGHIKLILQQNLIFLVKVKGIQNYSFYFNYNDDLMFIKSCSFIKPQLLNKILHECFTCVTIYLRRNKKIFIKSKNINVLQLPYKEFNYQQILFNNGLKYNFKFWLYDNWKLNIFKNCIYPTALKIYRINASKVESVRCLEIKNNETESNAISALFTETELYPPGIPALKISSNREKVVSIDSFFLGFEKTNQYVGFIYYEMLYTRLKKKKKCICNLVNNIDKCVKNFEECLYNFNELSKKMFNQIFPLKECIISNYDKCLSYIIDKNMYQVQTLEKKIEMDKKGFIDQ